MKAGKRFLWLARPGSQLLGEKYVRFMNYVISIIDNINHKERGNNHEETGETIYHLSYPYIYKRKDYRIILWEAGNEGGRKVLSENAR